MRKTSFQLPLYFLPLSSSSSGFTSRSALLLFSLSIGLGSCRTTTGSSVSGDLNAGSGDCTTPVDGSNYCGPSFSEAILQSAADLGIGSDTLPQIGSSQFPNPAPSSTLSDSDIDLSSTTKQPGGQRLGTKERAGSFTAQLALSTSVTSQPRQVRALVQSLRTLPTTSAYTLRDIKTEQGKQKLNFAPYRKGGANPIFRGVSTLDNGTTRVTNSAFIKFRLLGDQSGWDNPRGEWVVNQLYQDIGPDLLGFTRPNVDYILNKGSSYGNFDGLELYEGVIIQDAATEGTSIKSYADVFNTDGSVKQSVLWKNPDGSTASYNIPPEMAALLVRSVQNDQLFRYIFGDVDGHLKQYILRFTLQGGQISKSEVVTLDYGALGLLVANKNLHLIGSQESRRTLMEQTTVNIADSRYPATMPMPDHYDPQLLAAINTVAANPQKYLLFNNSANNTEWQSQISARAARMNQVYRSSDGWRVSIKGTDSSRSPAPALDSDSGSTAKPADSSGPATASPGESKPTEK